MRPPAISTAAWAEESSRLATQLVVKVPWQHLTWRHRLALAQQHAPSVGREAPAVIAPLEQLSSKQAGQLATVAPLQAKHDGERAKRDAASEQVTAAQQRVDTLSHNLLHLDDDIEKAKAQAAGKGAELSGAQPLDEMRSALKVLRAEVRALSVREAMLHKSVASKRAAEERAQSRAVARGAREQPRHGLAIASSAAAGELQLEEEQDQESARGDSGDPDHE